MSLPPLTPLVALSLLVPSRAMGCAKECASGMQQDSALPHIKGSSALLDEWIVPRDVSLPAVLHHARNSSESAPPIPKHVISLLGQNLNVRTVRGLLHSSRASVEKATRLSQDESECMLHDFATLVCPGVGTPRTAMELLREGEGMVRIPAPCSRTASRCRRSAVFLGSSHCG